MGEIQQLRLSGPAVTPRGSTGLHHVHMCLALVGSSIAECCRLLFADWSRKHSPLSSLTPRLKQIRAVATRLTDLLVGHAEMRQDASCVGAWRHAGLQLNRAATCFMFKPVPRDCLLVQL